MIVLHRADEVLELDIPEREDLVAGLLPRGDAVLFSAREKAGKGLLMLDLGVCVAAGEPFIGREVMQGPVMYLALEEGKRTIRDRLHARVGSPGALPFFVSFLDGSENQTFRLERPESIAALQESIIEHQPVLIVLDVLREAHDGRENESDDMAVLLRPIRQLAHQHNVTIVVTHHSSKAGGSRGSTSIPAAFDDTLDFTRDDKDNETDVRGTLAARGRDLPKVVQIVAFDEQSFRWHAVGSASRVSLPRTAREKIIALVDTTDEWLTAEEMTAQIENVNLKTVQNALTAMRRESSSPLLVKGTGSKTDPYQYRGRGQRQHEAPSCLPDESDSLSEYHSATFALGTSDSWGGAAPPWSQ